MYTTRHICSLFNVSHQTVKVWSGEFSAYLSPTATPGKNRMRQFTDDDLKVFALVAEMKQRGAVYDDIHVSLAAGQRGDLPEITRQLETKTPPAIVLQLQQNIRQLQVELADAREDSLRKDGKIELLEKQVREYQNEIKQLNREIGRLEAAQGDE